MIVAFLGDSSGLSEGVSVHVLGLDTLYEAGIPRDVETSIGLVDVLVDVALGDMSWSKLVVQTYPV